MYTSVICASLLKRGLLYISYNNRLYIRIKKKKRIVGNDIEYLCIIASWHITQKGSSRETE